MISNYWKISNPRDREAARLYDRHYTRLKFRPGSIGKNQITSTERALVLVTANHDALWTTQWPDPRARNDGRHIWLNSIFRNEGDVLSSDLISEAVAITRWYWWPFVPPDGFVSYIAPQCVKSSNPGYCYQKSRPRFEKMPNRTKGLGLIEYNLSFERLGLVQPLQASLWANPAQMQMAI